MGCRGWSVGSVASEWVTTEGTLHILETQTTPIPSPIPIEQDYDGICRSWKKHVPSPRRFRKRRRPRCGTRELRKPRKQPSNGSGNKQGFIEMVRNTQALAVAYDRDGTCCESKVRKKGGLGFAGLSGGEIPLEQQRTTPAFLRANLWRRGRHESERCQ